MSCNNASNKTLPLDLDLLVDDVAARAIAFRNMLLIKTKETNLPPSASLAAVLFGPPLPPPLPLPLPPKLKEDKLLLLVRFSGAPIPQTSALTKS